MSDGSMPPINQLQGRPLGRIFIKMGRLQRSQVHEAIEIQKERKGPIGEILVELGHVTKDDLQLALAAQIGMESIDLSKFDVPKDVVDLIPAQMANTYKVIPIEYKAEENLLVVALDSPDNFQATDDLKTLMGFNVRPVIAASEAIAKATALRARGRRWWTGARWGYSDWPGPRAAGATDRRPVGPTTLSGCSSIVSVCAQRACRSLRVS